MVRSSRKKNRRQGRSRRNKNKLSRSRKMQSAPPRLSLSSNNTRMRLMFPAAVTKSPFSKTFEVKDFVASATNKGLVTAFHEIKVLNIRVFYQSNSATSDNGSVVLIVNDAGENAGLDQIRFSEACLCPGAMVRRVWQNVSSRWHPTEPSDREFKTLDSADKLMDVNLFHSTKDGSFNGVLLIEANVILRGRNTPASQQALLTKIIADDLSRDLDMVVLP